MKQFVRYSSLTFICAILVSNLYAQNNLLSATDDDLSTAESLSPLRKVIDEGVNGIEVNYSFYNIMVSAVRLQQGNFQFIHVKHFNKMDQVGKPALPCRNDYVATPTGAEATIRIIETEYIEYPGYMIHPALKPALDFVGAPEPDFEIDEKTYQSNSFYPEKIVEVTARQKWRGISLNLIQIRPIQFNPVSGILRVYSKIIYKVEFNGAGRSFNQIAHDNSIGFTNQLKRVALNHKSIPDGISLDKPNPQHRVSSIRKDYILLAPTMYWMAADSLATWKQQLGYSVDIVLKDYWTSNQIKDSIAVRYNAWFPRPDYFVLIGDVDRMPTQLVGTQQNINSDLYYSCMDGTGDYLPDMARGRISVSSQSEALDVVMKIVDYERNPPGNYAFYNSGLNCAEFQDDEPDTYANRRFTHTSEEIRDYLTTSGYSINRVYYSNTGNNPLYFNNGYYSNGQPIPTELLIANGFMWDGDASDIIDEINSGRFYVLHRDHGYAYGWGAPGFSTSDLNFLSNGSQTPVVFSINCSSGAFHLSECFAEKFLRMQNGGAVGVIAASSTSSSGYNDGLSVGFFDAIWSSPGLTPAFGSGGNPNPGTTPHSNIYTIGDVLNHGVIRMSVTWNTSERQYQLFHYFGDPAMKLWTGYPASITSTHQDTIQCGSVSLTINSSSCPDALATLCIGGELIGKVQLSAGTGQITFSAISNIEPFATLTLSKHNYKPYIAQIPVVNCTFSPQASFNASRTMASECNSKICFYDQSLYVPQSWNWQISPATFVFVESTSQYSQNPVIQFTDDNIYTITLSVSNAFGSSVFANTNFITIVGGLSVPVVEDFESFPVGTPTTTINSWHFDANSSYSWRVHNDSTPSFYTGPIVDHTIQDSTGIFLYTEASSGNYGDVASFQTPCIDLSGLSIPTLSFWYHAFGPDINSLFVDIYTDDQWTNGIFQINGPQQTDYSDPWMLSTIDLSGLVSSNVIVRFRAIRGDGYRGDIAIDDIVVKDFSTIPDVEFSANMTEICEGYTVEFNEESCCGVNAWSWIFSGGSPATSILPDPAVIYSTIGLYTVSLTSHNSIG